MTAWIGPLYALAGVAELGGIVLVVVEWRSSMASMKAWKAANPNNNPEGSWGQVLLVNKIVSDLIGTSWRRVSAVTLLIVGVAAGTVANFIGL